MQHLGSAEELEQAARHSYVPVLAEPRPDFRGELGHQPLGGAFSLSVARMTPLRTLQTPKMAARVERDDLLLLCIHLAGAGRLRQHERTAELAPGVGVLYEARSAWDLNVTSDVHSVLLHFPRELLPMRQADISAGLARQLDAGSPGMRLLTMYVRELASLSDDLSEEQRHDAGRAGFDLLAMALRGTITTAPTESAAGEVLLASMRSHVGKYLADPRLTVAELARRHHVSIRHTHVLFARMGMTPGAYLRGQRLLAAQNLLADPAHDGRSAADIGAAVGLPESRTFERAFQRQFALTPARWRRDHRAGGDSAVGS